MSDELLPEIEVREAVRVETRESVRSSFEGAYEAAAQWREQKALPPPGHERRIAESARSLIEDMVQNGDVLLNLGFVRAWDDYTFEHSVQVAILALLIGQYLGLKDDAGHRLGVGAMLHDVGKAMVPREILQKSGRLTEEEMSIMREHPQLGWEFVHEGFPQIMPTSSIVALQHHERNDGGGCPYGRTARDVYLLSQIVAAADVFDALRAQPAIVPTSAPGRSSSCCRGRRTGI